MVKLEPIELDNNHIAARTTVVVASSMPYSIQMKRSRKATHPSKALKAPIQTSFIDPLTKTTHDIQIEEPSTTDDEQAKLQQFHHIDDQDNNYEDDIIVDEKPSIRHHHMSSKRPRLSYNKRLEANARERERVHNLTAAFEALRQVIPMCGDQSKLSRLSILRIACSYVLVLGALNDIDFSEGQNAYTLNESFHMLSCTILNELKRKKSTNNRHD